MKTAIHNVAPKTSAERVATLEEQIDRLAAAIRNAFGVKPEASAKPEPIANKYTAPPGDDDAVPVKNKGVAAGFTAPKGDD